VQVRHLEGGKFEVDIYSDELPVERGTPQGGIISPFAFDVGIIDMPLIVYIGLLLNYADDSSSLIAAASTLALFRGAHLASDLM
jgi:hypothetical protein